MMYHSFSKVKVLDAEICEVLHICASTQYGAPATLATAIALQQIISRNNKVFHPIDVSFSYYCGPCGLMGLLINKTS